MLRVTSNYHLRELRSWHDLPADQREFFDYLDDEDKWADRFVFAYGSWYDVHDAQVVNVDPTFAPFGVNVQPDSEFAAWDAVVSQSYWSGVVFRYPRGDLRDRVAPDEYGYVVAGYYYED